MGIAAGAAEGLFDREHLGVGGGLPEKIHHTAEVLVGMMQQLVALADGGEEVGLLAQRGGDGGDKRGIAQFRGMVPFGDGSQADGVDRPVNQEQIVIGQARGFPGAGRGFRAGSRVRPPAARRRRGGG